MQLKKSLVLIALAAGLGVAAYADSFSFSTGAPNGAIATASRPSAASAIETESADDFILSSTTTSINHATFYGLLPSGAALSSVTNVRAEIYRVFPKDSTDPPSGNVPTRMNSPSDVAFAEREAVGAGDLTFTASVVNPSFTAANSVVNGIFPKPNFNTLGEGAVTGEEVLFDVTFTTPFDLPADHYFFVPQVLLSSGNFLWLSGQRPTVPPFTGDLQSWIRNENLAPDWLRIGADIVGGTTFNAAFSLDGTSAPEPGTAGGFVAGAILLAFIARRVRPFASIKEKR